jgi:hypothetical protein
MQRRMLGIFRDESIAFALQTSWFPVTSTRNGRIASDAGQAASADGLGCGSSCQRMIDSRR